MVQDIPINLTDKVCGKTEPRCVAYEVRDGKFKGFLLRIQPTGHKAFYVEYARGKRSKLGTCTKYLYKILDISFKGIITIFFLAPSYFISYSCFYKYSSLLSF